MRTNSTPSKTLISFFLVIALSAWAGQILADSPAAPKAPISSCVDATSVLLVKGHEAYEQLLKTDSGLAELHRIHSARLGRIIVAMAEFADNREPVQVFLKKIESDKVCEKTKLPGWLVFADEYNEALKRIARTAPKNVQTSDLSLYESDADFEWGLEQRYTLSLLANLSIQRIAKRK